MDKALLDTDILSEIFRAKNVQVISHANAYKHMYGHWTISAMTVMEVVKGLHKMGRTQALQRFLQTMQVNEVLPITEDSAHLAGLIYADLERKGLPIGLADVMIAALAIEHQRTLVTGNTRHYQRVQTLGYQLTLADWRQPNP